MRPCRPPMRSWPPSVRATGRSELTELVDADPAGAIAEYAASFPVALVALATQGRSGIASTALGRVAAKIVNRSPRPLLVRPPQGLIRADPGGSVPGREQGSEARHVVLAGGLPADVRQVALASATP